MKRYCLPVLALVISCLVLTAPFFTASATYQEIRSIDLQAQSNSSASADEDIQYIGNREENDLLPIDNAEALKSIPDLTDSFENAVKEGYQEDYVPMESGLWYMRDARIGASAKDVKAGGRALRIRRQGEARMEFDRVGAGTVTVRHAVYGNDGPSTWELWYSIDGGREFKRIGLPVYTILKTLQTTKFVINTASVIRFKIVKVDDGNGRINIDNISISNAVDEQLLAQKITPLGSTSHLGMGNPSNAITSTSTPSNYLMSKTQYALSYHRYRGTPNWVSWHLEQIDLGSAPRQDDFRADNTLPTDWYHVVSSDYTNSGYDRGHMCPSADRTDTITNNSATFLMTNMIPQAPDNNQGPWAVLENYTRDLVRAGNECYIISGSYGFVKTIDGGNITVPARTWKVIVVLPPGSSDAARVNTNTRVIAVNMPNSQGIRSISWKNYRVSVDSIESATGYNLLSNVASSVQSVIEARVDTVP